MIISFELAIVAVFLISLTLSELAGWVRRLDPGHPAGWLFNLMGILTVLICAYMVTGFDGPNGEIGWLRWDHLLILFIVAIAPNAIGDLIRWAKDRS